MKRAAKSLPYFYLRNGRYLYRRAIPPEFHKLAGMTEFKQSLRTSDWDEAIVRYGEWHSIFQAKLNQLRLGKPLNERKPVPLEELRSIAAENGLEYKSHSQLMDDDENVMRDRYERWLSRGRPGGPTFDAFFGTEANLVTLNDVLIYYELHTRDERIGFSDREVSKKLTPVRLAVKRFNDFSAERLDVTQISRKLAIDYRSHLIRLMEAEQMKAGTANKQLNHIRKIITFYSERNVLNLANPFAKLSIKEDKEARLPYSVSFLKERWLDCDAFAKLNEEARDVLFAMIDTGCGAKELLGLAEDEILLNGEVPHIIIRANKFRKLKLNHRGRIIPLVGCSLRAFQSRPSGFLTYRSGNGADNLSATVMKFLRSHKLLETDNHAIYGLRHTFMDRLRHHRFPDELQHYLMGHKHQSISSHYGAGYSLSEKHFHMKKLENDWV